MSKKFDKLLEAATDSTLLEPNWDAIIDCFDSVRSGEVPAKAAMVSIRKRLAHENPHVVMYALLVLDACVKNCGSKMHQEVATRDFMEEFKNMAIESKYENVKNKVLEMLQCWANAFANNASCKIIVDTHNLMMLAGFDFPSIKEADAMFKAQVAPDWADGSECYRCRVEFGLLTRKHHCRACGQIFCDRCSSKEMPLPQFGIEKEVRVCDACFEKGTKLSKSVTTSQPKGEMKVDPAEAEKDRQAKEKLLKEKEEEDLALALALSQSEAEAKEKDRQRSLYSAYNGVANTAGNGQPSTASYQASEIGYRGTAPTVPESPSEISLAADDPLARYLDRGYWQKKKDGATKKVEDWAGSNESASAPAPSEFSFTSATVIDEPMGNLTFEKAEVQAAVPEDVQISVESTVKWCKELTEQVGVMESRIKSNRARGRPVVNDTAIQGLFMRLTGMHAQVLQRINSLDEERTDYESLQDHLAHIADARSAVNELRDENERRRQERLAEEQRVRQAQMKQTLDLMRMKKHQMLLEQRDAALQRFQQQEMEMQARRTMPQQPYYYGMPMQAPYPPASQGYHPGFYQQQQFPQPGPAAPNQQQNYAQPSQGYVQEQSLPGPAPTSMSTSHMPPQSYPYGQPTMPQGQPMSQPQQQQQVYQQNTFGANGQMHQQPPQAQSTAAPSNHVYAPVQQPQQYNAVPEQHAAHPVEQQQAPSEALLISFD